MYEAVSTLHRAPLGLPAWRYLIKHNEVRSSQIDPVITSGIRTKSMTISIASRPSIPRESG